MVAQLIPFPVRHDETAFGFFAAEAKMLNRPLGTLLDFDEYHRRLHNKTMAKLEALGHRIELAKAEVAKRYGLKEMP